MSRLIQGALDFQRRIFGTKKSLFGRLAKGQHPPVLFITCSDSRIDPNLLTGAEPGELFILRNAGNIVPPHGGPPNGEAATVEYAVSALKVRDIIVCGHSHCGAMQGLLNPDGLTGLPQVADWLAYARDILPKLEGQSPKERLKLAIQANVLLQLEHLRTHPSVAAALEGRTARLHGWVYQFETGDVQIYDPIRGQFISISEKARIEELEEASDSSPGTQRGDSI